MLDKDSSFATWDVDGKFTVIVHAHIFAAGHVSIHVFPNITYDFKENAFSFYFRQRKQIFTKYLWFPYRKLVFIDSTWNQCHKICNEKRLRSLPRVVIQSRPTMFLRFQVGHQQGFLLL